MLWTVEVYQFPIEVYQYNNNVTNIQYPNMSVIPYNGKFSNSQIFENPGFPIF